MKRTREMGMALPLGGAAVILAGLYVAGPGLTLLRLRRALREGNTRMLAELVDFPALRRGLARQLAVAALGAPRRGDALAPFGFSFVTGIARHEMSTVLTPAALIHLAQQGGAAGARWHIQSYRLEGPNQVQLWLRAAVEGTMRLTLRMEDGGWRLTGVRLPVKDLLRAGAADPP